ncbi:10958_t:CDS:1, partial [Gigaspora margarita]
MNIDTDISNKPNTQSSEQHSTTPEATNLTQSFQNQQSQTSYASILQFNNNDS